MDVYMNTSGKKKVLFVCTQNSARSQMAEGLLRSIYGDKYDVYSAGTNPHQVNPYAIKVMEEIGVSMSSHRSKSIDEFKDSQFDRVITVCDSARENCPYFTGGKEYLHHSFPDPALARGSEEDVLKTFRVVRQQIIDWIETEFA